MMEIWKDIKGYEGIYQVSNIGRIKRLSKPKSGKCSYLLKERIKPLLKHSNGCLSVLLSKNKINKRFLVHRLVAEMFLQNPNNYNIVNHKNKLVNDNRVENLEWDIVKQRVLKEKIKGYRTTTIKGVHIKLHRRIMENKLGRRLSADEIIHHIDENKLNNDISNLRIVSRAEHILLHPGTTKKAQLAVKAKKGKLLSYTKK